MKLLWKKRTLKAAGVVEAVLIIMVLVTLVVIFRSQLLDLVNDVFKSINKQAGIIY